MTRHSLWAPLPLFLLLAIGAAPLWAGDQDKRDDDRKPAIELQVLVIRATTSNSDVSAELKSLAEKLKKQFKFTGFKLEKTLRGRARVDEKYSADLLSDFRVEITPQKPEKGDDAKLNLSVEVFRREKDKDGKPRDVSKLKTSIRNEPGASSLLGGWDLGKGDALILAISGK